MFLFDNVTFCIYVRCFVLFLIITRLSVALDESISAGKLRADVLLYRSKWGGLSAIVGSVRRHSLRDRRARVWCVAFVPLPRTRHVASRRCCFVIVRSPCFVLRRRETRLVLFFTHTERPQQSRVATRQVRACDRRVVPSVYVLRTCTYRVKRFCAPNSLKGSSLIWSEAGRKRERGVRKGTHIFDIVKEHLVPLELFKNFWGTYILHTRVFAYMRARAHFLALFESLSTAFSRSRNEAATTCWPWKSATTRDGRCLKSYPIYLSRY